MTTTFSVISLGQFADIDPVEGNNTAENAGLLVGVTIGGTGDPLVNDIVTLSVVGDTMGYYDTDGKPAEHFRINDGNPQRYDSIASYNATITFTDGTTGTVTIVVAQDTDGNLYLVPSAGSSADLSTLQSAPILSTTFDSVQSNTSPGLPKSQTPWNYVTCFLEGTLIETIDGPRAIEDLQPGDLIPTMDSGDQPIRWVASSRIVGSPKAAPIRIEAGALGNTRDLYVSPQHRILLTGWRAELYMGEDEVLVPAIQLVNDQTIRQVQQDSFTYYHLLFDTHELIYAAGIASESFHPGEKAIGSMAEDARDELLAIFPQLADVAAGSYGPCARPTTKSFEAAVLR